MSNEFATDWLDRCASYDLDAGRCQLVVGHGGPHATKAHDAFLTLALNQISRWSQRQPALWLFDLSWAPGHQPQVTDESAQARSSTDR
jgi:hypothetical protein